MKLADDLGKGNFRTNGKTRNDLYMFAMAFGMEYYPDPNQIYDKQKDIEKNLFHDYYQDDLYRYLSNDYRANTKGFEAEPTGEGINFKNFAEAIYLYYISKPHLTAREKIEKSLQAIDLCVAQVAEQSGILEKDDVPLYTSDYQDTVLSTLLTLPENQIVAYIIENYYIPPDIKEKSKITAYDDTNTASEEYEILLKKCIKDFSHMGWDMNEYLSEDNKKTSLLAGFDMGLDVEDLLNEFHIDPTDSIATLLKKVDEKLKLQHIYQLKAAPIVTRTDILALGVCKFKLWYTDTCEETSQKDMGIPELFAKFKKDLNPILQRSRFQEISEKNLFDILAFFSLFRFID